MYNIRNKGGTCSVILCKKLVSLKKNYIGNKYGSHVGCKFWFFGESDMFLEKLMLLQIIPRLENISKKDLWKDSLISLKFIMTVMSSDWI